MQIIYSYFQLALTAVNILNVATLQTSTAFSFSPPISLSSSWITPPMTTSRFSESKLKRRRLNLVSPPVGNKIFLHDNKQPLFLKQKDSDVASIPVNRSSSSSSSSLQSTLLTAMEELPNDMLDDNNAAVIDPLGSVPILDSDYNDDTNPYNMNQIVESPPLTPPSTSFSLMNVIESLDNPSVALGRVFALVAAAVYGTNFATVKMLDEAMPMSISAALRFSIAALVVTTIVFSKEQEQAYHNKGVTEDDMGNGHIIEQERTAALLSGVEIGVWYFFGYLCQAEGLQTIGAGKSSFFNSLAVIVVPILDAVFRGRSLKGKNVASVLLAICGVGLFELEFGGASMPGITISNGDIWALGQTLFFGVGYWRLEQLSQNHPSQAGRLTVGQLLAVAGGNIFYALATMPSTESATGGSLSMISWDLVSGWLTDPFIVSSLLWTGLISTALALYLETVALKVVSASELTLLMTTISLWGAAFAYVTIGEVLPPQGMVGGLLILLGCILGNVGNENNIDFSFDSKSNYLNANDLQTEDLQIEERSR